jgi:hypothetical protein
MQFGRALVLAGLGGAATFVDWHALWRFFWFPFWQRLGRYGMHVHDIDAAYLLTFGPIVVVALFLATASIVAWFENKRFEAGAQPFGNIWRILFFGAFPGSVMFVLIKGLHLDAWRFPLSETTVCLVGFGLGYLWIQWRRGDEFMRPRTGER